ncbi:MAG TPA: class I adenylate-forming enzyme family protein, partial [Thermomicrobiales bacterium]
MNEPHKDEGEPLALRVEALIERAAARHPAKPAIIFGERCWTYAATLAELDRRAARLFEHGAAEGAVILTAEPLSDDFLLTFLACCRAGLIFIPLAQQTAPAELVALADRCGPTSILTADGRPHPALPNYRALSLSLPGEPGAAARQAALARSRDGGPDVPAFARQTSGTTRRLPKLALRAHRQLTTRVDPARWLWWYDPERVYCLLSPDQFYVSDTCQIFALGATLVQVTDTHPHRLEQTLLRHGVTDLWTVPAALHALAKLASPAPDGLRLQTIRTASMRLPGELRHAIARR